jgi:copper chaperone CopZ
MRVAGMTCGRCEVRVERSLDDLYGVVSNADFEGGFVEVSYSEAHASREELVAAIESAGFAVVGPFEPAHPEDQAEAERPREKTMLPVVDTGGSSCGCCD